MMRVVFAMMVGLLMAGWGSAQSDTVKTKLQVVSFKSLGDDRELYLGSKKMRDPGRQPKVLVSSNAFLTPVEYEGPRVLTLMRHQAEDQYQPVAQVRLPVGAKETIVLLVPGKKGDKLPFRAVAMDGCREKFEPGTRRIINFSKVAVRGEVGRKPFKRGGKDNVRFVCPPGKVSNVGMVSKNARLLESMPVILEYQAGEEKWNVLSTTRWFHTPAKRYLVFVYYDEQRKGLCLRGITDSMYRAEKEPVAASPER